jgi:glycosyltransferase involved in cell wall biosynthesis
VEESAPKISVCLLAYNHSAVIRETVASLLAQDFRDFELLLSDDCSSDDTWQVFQQLAAADARIRPLRTPHNLGMAGNANFTVAHAHAPLIALLHHDDLYAPKLLSAWHAVIERHPDMAFVSNAYAYHRSDLLHDSGFPERSDGVRMLEERLLPRWDCPFRGTALIRRSAWDAVGGMRVQFGLLADVDLWMRLARRWSIGYVREPVITVRFARPSEYPSAYTDWSWPRLRIGHEIHGINRLEHYGTHDAKNKLRWAYFRVRVSANICYWLAYALYKRRADMLLTSAEVASPYELLPEKLLRIGLAKLVGWARAVAPRSVRALFERGH